MCKTGSREPEDEPMVGNVETVRELLGEGKFTPELIAEFRSFLRTPISKAEKMLLRALDEIERLQQLAYRCEAHEGLPPLGFCVCCEAVERFRLAKIVARLKGASLSQAGWENSEDIVLLNGKPIGGTITHHRREFDRWWPAVKSQLLGEAAKEDHDGTS